jgi:EAL domain-containing protein (putative c-di-GMP-specific phosphodiesterase class I)
MDPAAPSRGKRVEFGRRRVAPRVYIIDRKPYIRTFLAETFEELGFIAEGCADATELAFRLSAIAPELVLIVVSGGESSGEDVLDVLAAAMFQGKIILLGAQNLPALAEMQRLGGELGFVMLPALTTPFQTRDLITSLSGLFPARTRRSMPVDLVDALANDWLELHYQPKIDPRSLMLSGAQAVIQLRHPTWGLVSPANFIACDGDPHFAALSEFVLAKAMADWRYFAGEDMPVEVAVTLPAAVMGDDGFVDRVRRCLPDHPAFRRMIVELDSAELIEDLAHAGSIARQLGRHNVGIALGNVGGERSSLAEFGGFPFVEIKVGQSFVRGSADNRLRRAVCTTILDFTRRFAARAVAADLDTRADFLAMRDAGFDLVQGPLFGKPMNVRKFARTFRTRSFMPP